MDLIFTGSCHVPKAIQSGVQSGGDAQHQGMDGEEAQKPSCTEGVHDLLQKCVQNPR